MMGTSNGVQSFFSAVGRRKSEIKVERPQAVAGQTRRLINRISQRRRAHVQRLSIVHELLRSRGLNIASICPQGRCYRK